MLFYILTSAKEHLSKLIYECETDIEIRKKIGYLLQRLFITKKNVQTFIFTCFEKVCFLYCKLMAGYFILRLERLKIIYVFI